MENSRVVGSRAGSTVSSIKLEGYREVLSDERVIVVVSKAVDILSREIQSEGTT